MNKLQFHNNKTLKLTNVLKYKLLVGNEKFNISVAIQQMQSYIKVKGVMQVGPLIQYSRTFMNEQGELDIEIVMMLQCNNFIHNVEEPYSMESVIRVPDALYCRYVGPEGSLKIAYDKISVEAFESNIKMGDSNYTIYVAKNEEDDMLTVDVFVPRAN